MTVDTNNNEPYRESKEHVLSHYFDELLPEDTPNEEANTEAPQTEAVAPTPSQKSPTDTKVENHLIEPAEPSIAVEQATQLKPSSTALSPLSDIPAIVNDSAAYQAHKQRLEKMLHQLTPVNPLPVASEPPSLLTDGDTKDADTPAAISPAPTDSDEGVEIEAIDPQELLSQTAPLSSEWLDNGRPHWAQDVFDILLIDVNGLKLALPLVALGHIEPIEEDLTPLFGQAEWFLGLQKTPFGNIKTIDTAQYVMPEKTSQTTEKAYKFVVSISGMNWGLAVDSIDQPITIDPEAIRWRAKRSNRPWMAGTVKDHMCVLLDIPVMGEILQKEDQNHRNPTGE